MVATGNTADDHSLQLARLKELQEVRDRVSRIGAELPDISTFEPSTHEEIRGGENARRMLLLQLDAVQVRLNSLERGADLSMTIGVIGQMSAGKSSLLNHLVSAAGQRVLAKALEREVGNMAIHTRLTYITHHQYVDRFNCDEVTLARATVPSNVANSLAAARAHLSHYTGGTPPVPAIQWSM